MDYGKSSEFTNTIFIRIIFTPHPPPSFKRKKQDKIYDMESHKPSRPYLWYRYQRYRNKYPVHLTLPYYHHIISILNQDLDRYDTVLFSKEVGVDVRFMVSLVICLILQTISLKIWQFKENDIVLLNNIFTSEMSFLNILFCCVVVSLAYLQMYTCYLLSLGERFQSPVQANNTYDYVLQEH